MNDQKEIKCELCNGLDFLCMSCCVKNIHDSKNKALCDTYKMLSNTLFSGCNTDINHHVKIHTGQNTKDVSRKISYDAQFKDSSI